MNGVQAVYHYPALDQPIDFRIVYLEVHERREVVHYGEQGQAYEAFCRYQKEIMIGEDSQVVKCTVRDHSHIKRNYYICFVMV